MNMKRVLSVVILMLLGWNLLQAQCEGVPSSSDRLVNDRAGFLSRADADELERKLVAYDEETSTQIAIVTEPSLQGGDDFERALCYFEAWGIGGSAEKSNGVLIYVARDDRKIRIMTGYGVEGFLPDAIAKRIIDNIITPAFRQGRYYAGFDRATDAVISYGKGEYTREDGDRSDGGFPAVLIIILFLLLIIIVLGAISHGDDDDGDDGGYWRGGRYDDPDRHRRGRRSRGGWIFLPGGGGWDSGGSGGFGGGGFGGFGGGLTGGGGAGGSW